MTLHYWTAVAGRFRLSPGADPVEVNASLSRVLLCMLFTTAFVGIFTDAVRLRDEWTAPSRDANHRNGWGTVHQKDDSKISFV
jgi:hypothetical protein